MTAILILWGHALAALLFGALGLAEWRRGVTDRWSGRAFVAALALTALWALAVAGIDSRDVSTHLAEAARNIAWLCLMAASVKRARAGHVPLAALYAVVMLVTAAAGMVALLERAPFDGDMLIALAIARHMLRMMAIAGALLLLSHVAQATEAARSGARRLFVLALAVMWGLDLGVAVMAFVHPGWTGMLVVVRGPVMAAVALLLAASTTQSGAAPATVSRTVAMQLLVVAALLLYAGATALAANLAGAIAGGQARAAQTAIVFGATAALLALVSTPWLRAWMRVKVAKHLFSHRYDYRIEWQRFTATLGVPGDGAAPLGTRIVKAVADLTDSPAGLLLVADGGGLAPAAGWRWADGGQAMEAGFAQHLASTGRIVSLDEARVETGETTMLPAWLMTDRDAWAVVPLIHGDDLAGAIVLARPPVDRSLDWEDFDLLRVAGRQAASYLAEDRAHAALADARRFDEFNRRFAFLMHDIKNVASQLTLVARNAERHADNPDFRADMVVTLRDSAARMTTLLARLGQHDGARPEATQPVDAVALVRRIAANWRAKHRIDVVGEGPAIVVAQPGRLEQALCHLVQNAVEASAAGAAVTIAVQRDDRGGVAIEVIDTGCGMAPGFVRDQLFRPFASSKPDGFGIGAYEARQLVRAMGGEMDVESREEEGTRFRIRLPIAGDAAAAMEQAA
ncbi:PEP-CTERM system histidine kinase PrsK [Sphingomonas sp. BT553]|uniref:histidine kinase n=2 Tax=Sphingomonas mollis TaxID=2795726 RepID=A0ABS0XJT4_9SPHN|nr:XrtA/PEP-CTERM system histidine kinase PrsK [Sphingomonas sp. BT553]MBJ6120292.1 PEP-CTERM system histidine kinase PrsK [Sphingomonas sp. BT553]